MRVILRDVDDQSPNVTELETATDIGTMIGQSISGLFSSLANLVSGKLGAATGDAELQEKLKTAEEEKEKWKWIALAGVGVAIVVFLIMFSKKK